MKEAHETTSSTAHTAKVTTIGTATHATDDDHMKRLATTFENSARRWEMVVYPAMFAFIVLASYGFYLIFSLTNDVASLARNVSVLTSSIDRMVTNMDGITQDMSTISTSMVAMEAKMDELETMRIHMEQINHSTRAMAVSADGMRYQMGSMSHSIRPLGQMNSFMPW